MSKSFKEYLAEGTVSEGLVTKKNPKFVERNLDKSISRKAQTKLYNAVDDIVQEAYDLFDNSEEHAQWGNNEVLEYVIVKLKQHLMVD